MMSKSVSKSMSMSKSMRVSTILLLILLLLLLVPFTSSAPVVLINSYRFSAAVPAGNVWSLVGETDGEGSTVEMPAGAVGDMLVVGVKWENTGDVTGITDAVNGAYTARTEKTHGNGDFHVRWFYLLATGTGQATVSRTTTGSVSFPNMFCYRIAASGTRAYDTEANGTGTSTSLASSAFTTATSNGITLAIYGAYSTATLSAAQIGGTAATAMRPAAQTSEHSWTWYYLNTVRLSSATATATLNSSVEWLTSTISFNAQ